MPLVLWFAAGLLTGTATAALWPRPTRQILESARRLGVEKAVLDIAATHGESSASQLVRRLPPDLGQT